jgi:hypothetical protein
MIFGFNTDIKAMGTVYHVQTEVREQEPRLESQIFVRGRCIGKRASAPPSDSTEEGIQALARAQHRWVVEAVRGGFVDDLLNRGCGGDETIAPRKPEPVPVEKLGIEFLGSQRVSGEAVLLRFRVLSGENAAAGAEVTARWSIESACGVLESTLTDAGGVAEMLLGLGGGTAKLEVRARLQGREKARRFLVQSAGA